MIRPPGLTLFCTATLVLLVLCGAALSQEVSEGELVFGARQKLPTFSLDPLTGYLELNGQYSSSRVAPKNTAKVESTDKAIQETLGLQTNGYIVHPNLVELSLSGSLGLTQLWSTDQGQSNFTNGTITNWDASATILREQFIPLTLYTNRSETLNDQSFGPTLRTTQTTYGADASIRSREIPTELRAYHREESQTATIGAGPNNFDLTTDLFEWHSEARPSPKQSLIWDYQFERTDQTGISGVTGIGESNSASLGHFYLFGPHDNYSLSSSLNYTDSTGSFSTQRLRWDELLRLRHSQNFETNYEYTLDRQDTFGIEQTQQRGTASFRHQLYKSLITTGRTSYSNFSFSDGGDSTDLSFDLTTDYTKRVPYGAFHANLGGGYDTQENAATSGATQVIDQSFMFTGFQPVFVAQQNVVPNSEIIRDATGRIFTEHLDYIALTTPEGIRINRIPGGAIPDNDPLFLSYDIGPLPSTEIDTTSFNFGSRYDIDRGWLRGLSPYFIYQQRDQTVTGGGGGLVPDNIRDYIYGLEYRIWDADFLAEYENHESNLFPYTATRLTARLDHRVSQNTTVNAAAYYTMTDYSQPSDKTTTMLVTGTASHELTRGLFVTGTVSWINIEDEIAGHTQGIEETLEMRWYIRQTEIYGRARNSTLDSESQDTQFQFFELGLRRHF